MFKSNFYLSAYFLHLNLNFQIKTVIPGKGIGVWFLGFSFQIYRANLCQQIKAKCLSPHPHTEKEK